MVEEKKDKGFVTDAETVLKEVALKVNRNNEEQIDKIVFSMKDRDITWKPKVKKISYEGGFKVERVVPMEKDFIPDKVRELAMATNEKGQIKVKVSYNWWKTEQDGEEVTYRFIVSEKTLDSWEILEDKTKSEEVLE